MSEISLGDRIPAELEVIDLPDLDNDYVMRVYLKGVNLDYTILIDKDEILDILEDTETKINKLEQKKQEIEDEISKLKQENV